MFSNARQTKVAVKTASIALQLMLGTGCARRCGIGGDLSVCSERWFEDRFVPGFWPGTLCFLEQTLITHLG